MPTAEARPWPSGPVVISTPLVWRNSGWPGVLRLPRAQRLDVAELEAEAAQVQLDVEGQAGVPAGQHEAVAAQPVHVAGVVAHLALEQRVGQRREAHRRAGVAVADLLHRIGRQHPDGVDGVRVHVGPVVRVVRASEGGDLFDCGHQLTPQIGNPGPPHTLVRPPQSLQAASRIVGCSFTQSTQLGSGRLRGLPSSVVDAARWRPFEELSA